MKSLRPTAIRRTHRSLRAGGFALLLVLSAILTAVSRTSPDKAWLAWLCLLPLMAAARALPPVRAGLAGALWGVSYYTAAVALPIPIFTAHLGALALLGLVSSGYCLLASMATRALGFAPLMLALLWVLAEALLHPLGLRGGLLAGTQVEMGWSAWLARALGYVFVAFAVVYANALLLSLIERTSVRLETDVTLSCAAVYPIRIFQQTDQSRTDSNFRSHPPRAPPVFR